MSALFLEDKVCLGKLPTTLTLPFRSVTGPLRNIGIGDNDDIPSPLHPSPHRCTTAKHVSLPTVGIACLMPRYLLVYLSLCCVSFTRASTQMQGTLPRQSSPTQSQFPKLGLNVAGRLKCYLWGLSSTMGGGVDTPLTPLFSASGSDKREEDEPSLKSHNIGVNPSSLYATVDYHFQKERWYGVKNVGLLWQWKFRGNNREDHSVSHRVNLRPSIFNVAFDHAIPPVSTSSSTDSLCLTVSWDRSQDEDIGEMVPWIKLGVHHSQRDPGGSFGIFYPLSSRFNLQWTSRWDVKSTVSPAFPSLEDRPIEFSRHSDPDWWIPDVKLDPFGLLSSENRFVQSNWRNHYSVDVKLKVSTKAPPLIFGSAIDEEPHATILRLDCSVWDERLERPSETTARFETAIIPSNWWQTIKEASRVTILHAQRNLIKK